jgi:hypothetical protein
MAIVHAAAVTFTQASCSCALRRTMQDRYGGGQRPCSRQKLIFSRQKNSSGMISFGGRRLSGLYTGKHVRHPALCGYVCPCKSRFTRLLPECEDRKRDLNFHNVVQRGVD